jgi:hypothetical protein
MTATCPNCLRAHARPHCGEREQAVLVPLDEPSMEDYPEPKERPVVKIHDGVRDTKNR